MLAENVEELSSLEKSLVEKEIQKLESQNEMKTNEQLLIAKAKLDAINFTFYNKI